MTYSDLGELLPDLLGCLEAAGFTTTETGTLEYYPGFPIPSYGSTAPSNLTREQAGDVESECANETYDWAQIYYVSQGAAVDAYVQSFMDQRPAILSCLREHGVTVDDDVPADELIYLVTEDSQAGGNEVCYTGDIFIGYSRP